jgi:hypothetical protein
MNSRRFINRGATNAKSQCGWQDIESVELATDPSEEPMGQSFILLGSRVI